MNVLFEETNVIIQNNGVTELEIPLDSESVTESYLYSSFNLIKGLYGNEEMKKAIKIDEDGVYIYYQGEEVVMWNYDEMMEDTEVVKSVVNAMKILYEEGILKLKEILK